MISINYGKLTANTLTGENLKHYHEGKSGRPVTLVLLSRAEDLSEKSDSWAHPLGL